MPAGKLNLTIEKGATFRPKFKYKNPDGSPINLSGFMARMQIREEIDAPATLIELTSGNGGIALGGSLGTIELYISATTTATLQEGPAVYDLELEVNGDVIRLLEGKITIKPEVTR